jgi:hypothetical protein
MKRAVRRAFLTTVLALLALAAPPDAHAQDAKRAFAEGSHVFRRILFDADCTPLKDFNDLAADPAHTILIVLGDTNCLTQLPVSLLGFVQQGGALMLATDQQVRDANVREQIQAVSGVIVLPQPKRADRRRLDLCYDNLEFCPLVQALNRGGPKLFFDARGNQLKVATNIPAVLDNPIRDMKVLGEVKPLAQLPQGFGHLPFQVGFVRALEQTLFAVGGSVGGGRVLVLADHSIFINEMMLPDTNHNVEFTTNCVNWLGGDGQERKKVLFVENGQIRDSFDIPLKYDTLPLDKAMALFVSAADRQMDQFNQRLAEPEGQAFANSFIEDWLANRKVPMDLFGQVVVVALTVALLLFGCYRIGVKGRYRHDLTVPLVARVVEQEAPRRPLAEQRHEALLRSGNLWESARGLARQCFAAHTASLVAPRVVAQGGWWRRWRTRRRVLRLWRLARSGRPVRVPPRRFKRLLAEVEQLKTELGNGTVLLEYPVPSPQTRTSGLATAKG